ncbi:hypothetical protein ARSEF4850_004144, partial [Beauveria asiatica]
MKWQTWEICVPADQLTAAENLFRSDDAFTALPPKNFIPGSRMDTYSRFGTRESNRNFLVIPDYDVHLDCRASLDIVHSLRGLPYPSLKAFAQSSLDRRNQLEMCDLIDGTNISEEWGEENLELNGVHDIDWVRTMQAKEGSSRRWWPTRPKEKREVWQDFVRTKDQRLDDSRPPSGTVEYVMKEITMIFFRR